MTVRLAADQNAHALFFERRRALAARRDRDVSRNFIRRLHELTAERRACVTVADDADGIAAAVDAAGEERIVREHGADADHDAGQAVSRFMNVAPRGFARDPAAVAGVGGDLAVERHRVLEYDERGPVGDIVEKHLVNLAALGLAHAGFDLDAGIAQDLRTLSGDERIGVETADEHAADAVLDDRVCAGRGAAPVAARLQRDVKIGSGCILGAVREGVALGVKAADVLVPALSDDAAVLDNDAADHGVGVYMTRAACGERQSTAHIVFFLIRHQNHLGEK